MEQKYQLISNQNGAPLSFSCYKIDHISKEFHPELEFILLLKGEMKAVVSDEVSILKEDDVLLINSNEIHEFTSEGGCIFASLKISTDKVPGYVPSFYVCNSSIDASKGKYYPLKHLVATLVKENSDPHSYNTYFNWSFLYHFLYELSSRLKAKEGKIISTDKYLERAGHILSYIDAHYNEGITLKDLADEEGLSVPYLSSFFNKYLGRSFLSYYNEVRLDHAVNDLLSSDASLEEIAERHGFFSARSFASAFKDKYKKLPSVYRKEQREKGITSKEDLRPSLKKLDSEDFLNRISRYLKSEEGSEEKEAAYQEDSRTLEVEKIDVNKTKAHLDDSFRVFTSVGRAKELLYADVQKILREFQGKIGFRYIKFHGLLSDDMIVYREQDGVPHYSFVEIDKVFDFLLSINLKPLVQLSFMPEDLALHPERTVYASPYVISEPKDQGKWNDLIRALLEHFRKRYGLKEMESWLYTVWNEPDTGPTLFGFDSEETFQNFYRETYNVIKKFDIRLKVGSPSMILAYHIDRDYFQRFIAYAKRNDCVPDFVLMHYYDNDFENLPFGENTPGNPMHGRLNRDEDHFNKTTKVIKKFLEGLGLRSLPVYLTEWNLTVSHRNLLNDTCFKSCYIAKNILENYNAFSSFGYWVLSDFIEETQPSPYEFHGGLGLYTINGIRKPHYFTFLMLKELGDELIESGKGYFITRKGKDIVMIVYNYQHFNYLFATGETFDMTYTERYTPFSKLGRMKADVHLINLREGTYVLRETIVNQRHGSAFDEWVRMGAPDNDKATIEYLKHVSYPKEKSVVLESKEGKLDLVFHLEPLEVRMIKISRKEE